jgi:hypothetical protein
VAKDAFQQGVILFRRADGENGRGFSGIRFDRGLLPHERASPFPNWRLISCTSFSVAISKQSLTTTGGSTQMAAARIHQHHVAVERSGA